ncbi:MAG: protein kinase domain-containing protein [Thermoplasmata archaeon]
MWRIMVSGKNQNDPPSGRPKDTIGLSYGGRDQSGRPKFLISTAISDKIRKVDLAIAPENGRGAIVKAQQLDHGRFIAVPKIAGDGKYRLSVAVYLSKDILFYNSSISLDSRGTEKFPEKLEYPEAPEEIARNEVRVWPLSSAYAQALQNIDYSISEKYPDLKKGKLDLNPNVKRPSFIFGSGNFGTVFRMDFSGKKSALKCFTRAAPDLTERYFYISWYLSQIKLPFLMNFRYYTEAVRTLQKPNEYFPVLLMDWSEGVALNTFISENLKNRAILNKLAQNFLKAAIEMQKAHVSHGDLSGDNILVNPDGTIMLIDYDGFYVPPLKGRKSNEKGHENFQHPSRGDEFNDRIDSFSALVIYLSIRAVAENPRLWEYNGGDQDRLLFRTSDFTSPDKSRLISDLRRQGKGLRKLADILVEYVNHDPTWSGFALSALLNY